MKNGTLANKALPIFMILINISLSVVVVFLMRHVQNLLDSDVKINLMEIVTQNKDAITSRLMLNIKELDLVSRQITDRMRQEGISEPAEIRMFLNDYFTNNNNEKVFIADTEGIALWGGGGSIDISGRKYFRLAVSGTANISDKTISRLDGTEIFVVSVPLRYRGEIIGTVQRVHSQQEMHALCTLSLFSSQGYMYIINSEGYIILHTEHVTCRQASDNYYRDLFMMGNPNASAQLREDIRHGRDGFMETTIDGIKSFAAYTPIETAHDWFLITSVPTLTVSPNAKVVITIFYSILLVVVLIFTSSLTYFLWYKNKQKVNLERIAFVDTITGGNTYNKFLVDTTQALRAPAGDALYIVKFDIDNFKYVNKFYGFEFGDGVLRRITEAISNQLHQDERIARVSSDHFVMLLRNASEERIAQLLASVEGDEITLYFSAGVYPVTDRSESVSLMVDKAGTAAQVVKGVLGKSVSFYTEEFDRTTVHNEQLKRAVLLGLEHSEFIPFYQPKVNVDTGKLVGCEALARWRTAEGKLISPAQFIPMCEQTGMITSIDMMIYEKVLIFLKRHLDAGVACVPVSVNFSRLHLLNEDFFDKVVNLLHTYEVPAHLIELELTESAIFDNIANIITFTERMHSYGFLIAMDDFGSGYSSLNMLKDVPIDILKIDKGFLDDAADNSRRNIIFSSIVTMAKELNISIVVEGVEFIENVNLMKECGCTVAQGYYFARPMPAEDFDEMLTTA